MIYATHNWSEKLICFTFFLSRTSRMNVQKYSKYHYVLSLFWSTLAPFWCENAADVVIDRNLALAHPRRPRGR